MSRPTYVSNAMRLTSPPTFPSDLITSWVSIIGIGQSDTSLYLSILLCKQWGDSAGTGERYRAAEVLEEIERLARKTGRPALDRTALASCAA